MGWRIAVRCRATANFWSVKTAIGQWGSAPRAGLHQNGRKLADGSFVNVPRTTLVNLAPQNRRLVFPRCSVLMTLGNYTCCWRSAPDCTAAPKRDGTISGRILAVGNCVFTTWILYPYSDPQNHAVSFAQVQRSDDPVHDFDMAASTPRASPLDLAAREGHLHHRAMWRAPT